jgi:hypothetical protein
MVFSIFHSVDWPNVVAIILGSGTVAALLSGFVSLYLARRAREEARYEKLYGQLRLKFAMMKIMTENQQEVINDIKEWHSNVEVRIDLLPKHINPLVTKWIGYRDEIKNLFELNSGLIKKEDFSLVADFMDGCIKREITEDGKNFLAVNESRTNKLMDAVAMFQNKLL